MKLTIPILASAILLTACGHVKKEKSAKNAYSPRIAFSQEEKTFEATVKLPKDMKDIVHEW